MLQRAVKMVEGTMKSFMQPQSSDEWRDLKNKMDTAAAEKREAVSKLYAELDTYVLPAELGDTDAAAKVTTLRQTIAGLEQQRDNAEKACVAAATGLAKALARELAEQQADKCAQLRQLCERSLALAEQMEASIRAAAKAGDEKAEVDRMIERLRRELAGRGPGGSSWPLARELEANQRFSRFAAGTGLLSRLDEHILHQAIHSEEFGITWPASYVELERQALVPYEAIATTLAGA